VPPRKTYPFCFVDIVDWNEVAEIDAFTVVHRQSPLQPANVPYAYEMIKLDGADVGFSPSGIRSGRRTKSEICAAVLQPRLHHDERRNRVFGNKP
jgi:uncharacterized OB-fold protein